MEEKFYIMYPLYPLWNYFALLHLPIFMKPCFQKLPFADAKTIGYLMK